MLAFLPPTPGDTPEQTRTARGAHDLNADPATTAPLLDKIECWAGNNHGVGPARFLELPVACRLLLPLARLGADARRLRFLLYMIKDTGLARLMTFAVQKFEVAMVGTYKGWVSETKRCLKEATDLERQDLVQHAADFFEVEDFPLGAPAANWGQHLTWGAESAASSQQVLTVWTSLAAS